MNISEQSMTPFDKCIFNSRLKTRKISCNDLINHPSVTFSKNQLSYYKRIGMIPKSYMDEIENALSDTKFFNTKCFRGTKYIGNLVDFGPSEYSRLMTKCKSLGTSMMNVLSIEHIAYDTLIKYKKERHVPSDLIEKIERRLNMMEEERKPSEIVEEPKVESDPIEEVNEEIIEEKHTPMFLEAEKAFKTYKYKPDYTNIINKLKMVIHCNGEASLNLNNIPERYDCNLETFLCSVFSLVSNEGYVIYTTYNNGKPIFSLGESM